MTKDLLEELRQNEMLPESPVEVEPEEQPQEVDTNMDEFFEHVEWIRTSMDQIQTNISRLRNKHSELLSAPQQNEKTKQEVEELTDNIKSTAGRIRLRLKQLEHDFEEREAADPTMADSRIHRTQLTTVTRKFMDQMASYNKAQTDYRDACKAQIKYKMEIAECPRTDDEIEEMLESDNPQIFTQGILMDTQQARQNAADIEARHVDIMRLEKSIRELHELFMDLATMVDSQGELIDQIKHNVSTTQDHVEAARIATKSAVQYKKKSRKMQIAIIGVVLVIVAILVIVLAVELS